MHKLRAVFQQYRVGAALILLIAVTVYANLNLLFSRIQLYPELKQIDSVTIHERRIEQIKKVMSATAALGYVTTVENEKE